LTVDSIVTPYVSIAPFAGNLKVEQNLISLSQLEMSTRGGRITGQCSLELAGRDSVFQAHVRATDLLSSHGEPFDGNAAFVVSGRGRSVDGRAEILRIGKRHLLDLLDLQDPHRVDPSINRVRQALAFGYPQRVKIVSEHGFANVHLTFGGIAQLISVNELRGLPVGPLIDRTLASMDKTGDEP
jgi:hypothetical protein